MQSGQSTYAAWRESCCNTQIPITVATKAAADNPNWEQAMNGPDSAGYWEVCKKELHTLVDKKNAWDVVECQHG